MGGHVGEVFGGEKLIVIVEDGIMCHVFIDISTEQQTDLHLIVDEGFVL